MKRKRNNRKKDRDIKRHAKRRFHERFGIDLTDYVHEEIRRKLQFAKIIERQSNRVTLFKIEYQGRMLRVVYDRMRKLLVTVLPETTNKKEGKNEPNTNGSI